MEKLQNVAEIQISYTPIKANQCNVKNSQTSFDCLIKFFPKETIHLKEYFVVLYLDRKNDVIGAYRLSEGGMTATVADIRLILGVALKIAAHGIILSHNHPSGNLKPSVQDINMTKKVMEACSLMELQMLDHLIIGGESSYLSLVDDGLI